MRKQTALIMMILLFVNIAGMFADEAVLIDFNMLVADMDKDGDTVLDENTATAMDFGKSTDTAEMKALKKTSLAIVNWEVELASSSQTVINQMYSTTKEAKILDGAKYFAGETVLGIRVHFPVEPFNSWAKIKPPFEIPAYQVYAEGETPPEGAAKGMTRFEGSVATSGGGSITKAYGIVKNVGVIKYVAVTVKGLNYPHGLTVILLDQDGNEQYVFMGYLKFDGWKEMKWENPQYVADVRNRELKIAPLYPSSTPFVKFGGFIINRDAANDGGDFICYIKDVKILFEKAVLNLDAIDIDDESLWGIISEKERKRQEIEAARFGDKQLLRYIEAQKAEKREEFTEGVK